MTDKSNTQAAPFGHGLTSEQADLLLVSSLKPEEIGGAPDLQHRRVRELLHWFARLTQGNANPKWLRGHAFELAYYVATMGPDRSLDVDAIHKAGFLEGVNISPEDRRMLERVGSIAAQPTPEPVAQARWCAAVGELLGHLSDVLSDETFDLIDTAKWNAVSALVGTHEAARPPVALQGRDELPQLPPRSLLSLWAFISDSELAHIGLKARQKIENRVFELMQIYARSALQAARASLPAGGGTAPTTHISSESLLGMFDEFQRSAPKKLHEPLASKVRAALYQPPQPSETPGPTESDRDFMALQARKRMPGLLHRESYMQGIEDTVKFYNQKAK